MHHRSTEAVLIITLCLASAYNKIGVNIMTQTESINKYDNKVRNEVKWVLT